MPLPLLAALNYASLELAPRLGGRLWWLPLLIGGFLLWAWLVMTLLSKRATTTAQFVVLRGRISCPECSYLLDLDDRYCPRCGVAVAQPQKRVSCSSCRGRNWEDDKFCRHCGKTLKTEEPANEPAT